MGETFSVRESGPTRRVELSGESGLVLPLGVRFSCAVAMFKAPTREAQKLVPTPRLVPTELVPGKTLVGVVAAEVQEAEGLRGFGMLGIVLPVRYRPRFRMPFVPLALPQHFEDAGYYLHRALTTSQVVQALHTNVMGSSSLLADLRFDEEPFWRSAAVRVEGAQLLSLEIKKARTMPVRLTTHLYSMRNGNLLRTPLPLRGEFGFGRGLQSGRLALGTHYVADELRALGLGDAPAFTFYGEGVESVLAAPDRVLAP